MSIEEFLQQELMNVYRQAALPAIYAELEFVRKSGLFLWADCPDDLPRIRKLQRVVAGNACLSELERPHQLFVRAEIPDNIPALGGISYAPIVWRVFYWKLWDAESLVIDRRPTEAIHLSDAAIDIEFLDSLARPQSCLPMLRQTQITFNGGYRLEPDVEAAINEIEKPLLARIRLQKIKPSRSQTTGSTKSHHNSQIPPRRRETVLRRDNYKCVFCGKGPPDTQLEVNHIIPRSQIRKLSL